MATGVIPFRGWPGSDVSQAGACLCPMRWSDGIEVYPPLILSELSVTEAV